VSERTAIVIGGGIGGLAVAAGLSRTGWRVTVFEQAPRFAALGAGIALAPNAVRALDWLGVGAALRPASHSWPTPTTPVRPGYATWPHARYPPRRIYGGPPTHSVGSHRPGRSSCGTVDKSE
jgi:2-polyprenyl-6-methoxyphenol hydroxylase-like FAD-dependent oxidoreductase